MQQKPPEPTEVGLQGIPSSATVWDGSPTHMQSLPVPNWHEMGAAPLDPDDALEPSDPELDPDEVEDPLDPELESLLASDEPPCDPPSSPVVPLDEPHAPALDAARQAATQRSHRASLRRSDAAKKRWRNALQMSLIAMTKLGSVGDASLARGFLGVAEPLETSLHCGPYRIVSCIGSGAMGVVYEAVDTRLGRRVALKRPHPHIASRPGAQARFLLEGQAAARIRHPHVVEVLALGSEDSGPFLAMELLEGRNLAAVLESRERLSVSEALETVLPVIAAVAAAHDAQVIHRDLKPSNVFLARGPGGQPWPKVVDFGVSAIVEGDVSTLTLSSQEGVVGTIAYLPPEQASRESGGSFAGDQYALAVLLYECVTGVRPFSGGSAYQMLSAILSSPMPAPSERAHDVPPAFDAVVARAMSRDPRDRFPSMREFGAALLPQASERARSSYGPEFLEAPDAAGADSRVRKTLQHKKTESAAVTHTVDSPFAPAVSEAKPPKTGTAALQSFDGVGVSRRGDTAVVLWKAPARIHRSRWLFDGLDRMVAEEPDGILVLMIILPTSSPPDRATSVENAARALKLRRTIRRAVVVIPGDSAWHKVARGVLRAFMPWTSSRLAFASTAEDGIAKLLEAADRKTPKKAAIERDVRALYAELDPTLVNERGE